MQIGWYQIEDHAFRDGNGTDDVSVSIREARPATEYDPDYLAEEGTW